MIYRTVESDNLLLFIDLTFLIFSCSCSPLFPFVVMFKLHVSVGCLFLSKKDLGCFFINCRTQSVCECDGARKRSSSSISGTSPQHCQTRSASRRTRDSGDVDHGLSLLGHGTSRRHVDAERSPTQTDLLEGGFRGRTSALQVGPEIDVLFSLTSFSFYLALLNTFL